MILGIHSMLLFLIEALKMGLAIYGVFYFKPKKQFITYLLGAMTVLLFILIVKEYENEIFFTLDNNLYYFISILIIALYLFGSTGDKKFVTIIITYVSLSIIDMALSGGLLFIFKLQVNNIVQNIILDLFINSISVFILIIFVILKRRFKKNIMNSYYSIKPRYIIVVLLGIIACGCYLAPIQMFGISESKSIIQYVMILGGSISGIIFIIVLVAMVIMNDMKNHYRNLSEISERLFEQQKNYYQTLIEKEQYTKRFRHDLNNHIYCLQHLNEQKKYDDLSSYLNEMRANVQELNIDIQTGNEIVNIIVNDIYSKYKTDKISINWKGILPYNMVVSRILCK